MTGTEVEGQMRSLAGEKGEGEWGNAGQLCRMMECERASERAQRPVPSWSVTMPGSLYSVVYGVWCVQRGEATLPVVRMCCVIGCLPSFGIFDYYHFCFCTAGEAFDAKDSFSFFFNSGRSECECDAKDGGGRNDPTHLDEQSPERTLLYSVQNNRPDSLAVHVGSASVQMVWSKWSVCSRRGREIAQTSG